MLKKKDMTTKFKIGIIALLILLTSKNISFAQNDTLVKIDKTYPSFKIKTELVNWTGLNPNLYFDYKINKIIGVNAGILYHFTGIIWTAPYVMSNDNILEWSYLRGYGVDLGIKLYSKPTKYYYFSCKIDRLSLNRLLYWSERREDQEFATINYLDLHIRLLRGIEYFKNKSFFKEIYYGIGLLIIEKKYDIKSPGEFLTSRPIQSVGVDNYIVPTFHFAFNIGWKLKK